MKNNPYRSLVGFLEGVSYRLQDGIYFIQFTIAEWLRERLKMKNHKIDRELSEKQSRKKLLKKVSKLLESKEASNQPWYLGVAECGSIF